MTTRSALTGFFLAVVTLIAAGLSAPATQAAPVNNSATTGLNGLSGAEQGNVVLVQRRRVQRSDRSVRRRVIRRHDRRVRRRVIRRHDRRVRRRVIRRHRWGHRGRRYRRGNRWYFWAPWAGSYVYFSSYNACYASCRDRGYSRPYCSDLCAW